MGNQNKRKKKKVLPKDRLECITATSLEEKINKEYGDKRFKKGENPRFKMSEVILDFAEPMLKDLKDNASIKKAIVFSITVWNLSVLFSGKERVVRLKELSDMVAKDDPLNLACFMGMVNLLLRRKEEHFKEYNKPIIGHVFGMKDGNPRLEVAYITERH